MTNFSGTALEKKFVPELGRLVALLTHTSGVRKCGGKGSFHRGKKGSREGWK